MQAGRFSLTRWAVVFVVLVGLPVLAIPGVAQKMGSLIYSGTEEPLPAVAPPQKSEPALSESPPQKYAPVTFTESEAIDRDVAAPRAFQPPPRAAYLPSENPVASIPSEMAADSGLKQQFVSSDSSPKVDWSERIAAVRLQLDRWGAEYLLLEMVGPDAYRFRCRMATRLGGKETQAFEVTAADPASAAEQMLDAVADWKAKSGGLR